ncbi:hypothetical protein PV327_006314 [Microctonus hyperodae]|uniref:Uncharacterized protein n=1 Tax=Microctonus hyperodae TaxID=165561 RepID=A0AA39F421_MICHY|nr:hypothetical protein PV327_006314 [Microctonus hyperodae]
MDKMYFINILLIFSWLGIASALVDDSRTIGEQSMRIIGQRPQCNAKKDYDLITEYKRLPEHRYVNEYKRFPEYRYSFGIGKRWFDDSNIKRTLPYSFGVGKRSQLQERYHPMKYLTDYLTNNNDNNLNNDVIIDDFHHKRGAPLRPYDFGIGKRNKILDELQGLQSIDYNFEVNQREKQNTFDSMNNNKIFNGAEQLMEQY